MFWVVGMMCKIVWVMGIVRSRDGFDCGYGEVARWFWVMGIMRS